MSVISRSHTPLGLSKRIPRPPGGHVDFDTGRAPSIAADRPNHNGWLGLAAGMDVPWQPFPSVSTDSIDTGEIANVVRYLALEALTFLTGQKTIAVDGGETSVRRHLPELMRVDSAQADVGR
ncbi:hypothetical protein [Nocardia nepalensis]|uniref:hypothetical protein n=1 Tax=Nocardia nepalensis TaxID=3375448 RepID=UPI003B6855B5